MPSDQSIDSISLQIGADAHSAEESIDKLCTSLNKLKTSLSNVGKYSNQLSLLSSSLSSLSLLDTAKLSSVAKSVSQMGSINVKASGINLLTNSLTRLVKESANFDPSKMTQIRDSLKSITDIGDASENMIEFVKSLSSFARSGEKMKETAQVFPALGRQLLQFFALMQNVTVSDNTVRLAEALAMIAKSGTKAGTAMENLKGQATGFSKAMRLATGIVNGLENGLKSLLNIAKKLGSGALTGLRNLFMQISGLGKSSTAVTGLTANIKTLLGTMIGFHGIVGLFNWSKQMMTMGADVTEIDHIVQSVFGEDMVGEVEAWANEAVEKFGIASTAAKQYAGTMSAMFQASNIARQDANKMSTDLVGLAGDLSAFYNIDTETAYNKIKSGMAGMVRPLRDLGIDLSVATLKEYALAQGITKSWTEMTQAEKVMLRYRYLMDATKQQQGDFA